MPSNTWAALGRHRFVLGFALLSLLGGLSFGIARVTTSLYAIELSATSGQMGLIAAAQSIGLLVMGLPVGMLVEHFGARGVFILGSVLAGLCYAIVPQWRSPEFLICCSALVSFCVPLRYVALNAVFMEKLAQLGDARAGWYRGNSLIGMLLVGPAVAVSVVAWLGFSGAFYFIALSIWVSIGLALRVLHDKRPEHRFSAAPREMWRRMTGMFASPALQETIWIELFAQAAIGYFSFFIVPIAVQSFHFSARVAADLITSEGLLFILALFFFGGLVPRFGLLRIYQISLSGASLALLILGLSSSGTGLLVGSLLLGVTLGLLQVVNLSRFAQLSSALGRGHVAGLIALVGPAGAMAGSLAGGLWGQFFGLQSFFLCLLLPLLYFAGRLSPARQSICSSLN